MNRREFLVAIPLLASAPLLFTAGTWKGEERANPRACTNCHGRSQMGQPCPFCDDERGEDDIVYPVCRS